MRKNFDSSGYIREKYRQFVLKLEREKDAGIIQHLEDQKNVTEYVRNLISEDLNNGNETEQV